MHLHKRILTNIFLYCSKKLEQSYQLCFRCERILKRKLCKVKNNVLGSKLAQISAKKLNIFDLHMAQKNQLKKSIRKYYFVRISCVALILLAIVHFIRTSNLITISKETLDTVFSPTITHYVLVVFATSSTFKLFVLALIAHVQTIYPLPEINQMILNLPHTVLNTNALFLPFYEGCKELLQQFKYDDHFLICLAGIILSIIIVVFNGSKCSGKLLILILLWSINMVLPVKKFHPIILTGGIAYSVIFDLIRVRNI